MKLLKNRTVLGVLCILLSLVICFGVTPLFNSAVSQKAEIVRVKADISTGEKIAADMIETVEVGGYNLPNNVIKTEETVVGTYALSDFSVGDYILNDKISETIQAENAYLYQLDGSQQAISVSIKKFANGLSGKLESGDVVSIIATDFKGQGVTVIPTELTYVEVISVTSDTGSDANTGEEYIDGNNRELPSTVTLLVTQEQSKILAELELDGVIHLSLVYRGLPENSKTFLDSQYEILEELYPTEKVTDEQVETEVTDDRENSKGDVNV